MRELEVLREALCGAPVGKSGKVGVKATDTGVYDVVSDADLNAEAHIIDVIRSSFPDDTIISEETSPDACTEGRSWAIDPIDGSMNMVRGIPFYGMQGVFMIDGDPKVSVICLPEFGEVYEASSDGAFMNGSRIHTADARPLRECILTTGDYSRRSQEYRSMQAALLSECRDSVARIKMFGAACVDFAYLASGRSDIHIRFVNKIWDFMPGLFLAEKAGARYDRDLLDSTGILMLCSSGMVLDEAVDMLLPMFSSSSSRRSGLSMPAGTRAGSSRCSPRRS